MDNRSTAELIVKLNDDIVRCRFMLTEALNKLESNESGDAYAEYEHHARNLIRSVLAFIEAVTFSVKVSSINKCLNSGIELTFHERYLAIEQTSELSEDGKIKLRSAKLRLASNVRFAFRLLEKASKKPTKFDVNSEWWGCLKNTIRVRDRLMHPKMPADIDLSHGEILNALKAHDGFFKALQLTDENNASQ